MNRTRIAVSAAAAALLLGTAACGSSASPPGAANGPTSTSAASTGAVPPGVTAASPTPSAMVPAPPASGVSVAAGPTDPVAAAAWQALMSADGEYVATAAYQAVIATYGPVEPYVSIQTAEERHVLALTRQLQRLGVDVPTNPYLGQVPAPADLQASATAEAAAEVANVAMYDRLLPEVTGDAALTRVFDNLRSASQDVHLAAFLAAADNGGQLTMDQMVALGLGLS